MRRETELEWATGAVDEDVQILEIKNKRSKTTGAIFVQAKGTDPFAVKHTASFMQRRRHLEVIKKSDGEHCITVFKRTSEVKSIPEESPIESAVKEVTGMIRSVKSDLKNKLDTQIDRRRPILAWLPTYVADVMSRRRVGQDGRTAEGRRTGRNWRRPSTFNSQASGGRGFVSVMEEGQHLGRRARTGAIPQNV